MNTYRLQFSRVLLLAVALPGIGGACDNDPMVDQAKYESYEATTFYEDGASARDRIPNTVPWRPDGGDELSEQPATTMTLLRHGQERFNIYCANCHGRDGYGQGMIVQRGYPPPPTYHQERLRHVPDEHIFAVIGKGIGKMPPQSSNITAYDRWAIIAYIRALQLSQFAAPSDVPKSEMDALNAAGNQPALKDFDAHDD